MTHKNSLLYCTTLHSSPAVCALYSLVPITVLQVLHPACLLYFFTLQCLLLYLLTGKCFLLYLLTGNCFLLYLLTGECFLLSSTQITVQVKAINFCCSFTPTPSVSQFSSLEREGETPKVLTRVVRRTN